MISSVQNFVVAIHYYDVAIPIRIYICVKVIVSLRKIPGFDQTSKVIELWG